MSKVLNELQDYTFTSKYARWLKDQQRRETWKEAVNRVRGMMLTQYKDCGKEAADAINTSYDMMYKRKVLGSQRALQFGGEPAFKKNARVFNCTSSYCDRLRFFQECFWLLLCGCGTGFSVQKHHVAKLPQFAERSLYEVENKVYQVPDTIEGWADSVGVLLTNYFGVQPGMEQFAEYTPDKCYSVSFDFSLIREAGAPLSNGIGKAPGPAGLELALQLINKLLHESYAKGNKRLRPIDAYDIVMYISDAVLSGGVRRSATIAIFSPDDIEMATAKTGNWFNENPQRARSNNSALLVRSTTTKAQFQTLMESVKEFGEPGFIWADSTELLVNPCCEIGFFTYDIIDKKKFEKWKKEKGVTASVIGKPEKIGLKSGWCGCNLSTINCGTVKTEEDFYERAEAAAAIGTFQAGFTKMDYLGETSENIFKREALLGVSMTGTMENYDIVLNPRIQTKAARIVKKTNARIAKLLGINPAARATCLKPEGTSSCMLGTSSGVHPHHHTRYIRRLQVNRLEEVYQHFATINRQACEPSVWSSGNNDDVICFPIEVPDGSKTKNMLPAIELLKVVKSTQQNWVLNGKTDEHCTMPWLSHNVSNTVTVRPDEWEGVGDYLYKNRKYFCGVSLLPSSGDKDYPQAPFTAVYTSRQIVKEYGEAALWTSGLIDSGIELFGGLWAACDAILDRDSNTNAGSPYYNKVVKFAEKYFDGDLKRLTYCMKDVSNWKQWHDLSRSFDHVDYTTMIEKEDNTTPEQEISCAGGKCEVTYG